MKTFTLDTNCIIHVEAKQVFARHIQALAAAHRSGFANIALVAVSASEQQLDYRYMANYEEFTQRVGRLDMSHLPVLKAIAYRDISFWDQALWADEAMVAREKQIHAVLFPTISFSWPEVAAANSINPSEADRKIYKKWRNSFCDRQMFWAHDHNRRDVFVSSDKNFKKLVGAAGFPAALVCNPEEAAAMI